MSPSALIFMVTVWSAIVVWTVYCFVQVLRRNGKDGP